MGTDGSRTGPLAAVRAFARGAWAAPCFCSLLLVFVALDSRDRGRTTDAAPYHEAVRNAAVSILAVDVGDWVGTREDPPASAVAILHPNQIVGRRFRNDRTREAASFLFVHCSDSRDLLGHYPPVCYPSNGLTHQSEMERDWEVEGVVIRAMRYRFADRRLASPSEIVVDNFMVLPTGAICRDMEAMKRLAKDRRTRHFGAAQFQVVTDGRMSDARRDEIVRTLLVPTVRLLPTLKAHVLD